MLRGDVLTRVTPATLDVLEVVLKNEPYGLAITRNAGLPTRTVYLLLASLEYIGWVAGWIWISWIWIFWDQERRRRRRRNRHTTQWNPPPIARVTRGPNPQMANKRLAICGESTG